MSSRQVALGFMDIMGGYYTLQSASSRTRLALSWSILRKAPGTKQMRNKEKIMLFDSAASPDSNSGIGDLKHELPNPNKLIRMATEILQGVNVPKVRNNVWRQSMSSLRPVSRRQLEAHL